MTQRIDWSNPANAERLLAAILAAQGMKVCQFSLTYSHAWVLLASGVMEDGEDFMH